MALSQLDTVHRTGPLLVILVIEEICTVMVKVICQASHPSGLGKQNIEPGSIAISQLLQQMEHIRN